MLSHATIHVFSSPQNSSCLPKYLHAIQRLKSYSRITDEEDIVISLHENPIMIFRSTLTEFEIIIFIDNPIPGFFYSSHKNFFWSPKSENIMHKPHIELYISSLREKYDPDSISILFDTPSPPKSRTHREEFSKGFVRKPTYKIEHLLSQLSLPHGGKNPEFNPELFKTFFPSQSIYSKIKAADFLSQKLYAAIKEIELSNN